MTPFAMDRLFLEIIPRLEDVKSNYTKAVPSVRRKGDNVLMGQIEITGNNLENIDKANKIRKMDSNTGRPQQTPHRCHGVF